MVKFDLYQWNCLCGSRSKGDKLLKTDYGSFFMANISNAVEIKEFLAESHIGFHFEIEQVFTEPIKWRTARMALIIDDDDAAFLVRLRFGLRVARDLQPVSLDSKLNRIYG